MTAQPSLTVDEIVARGVVTDGDVGRLRRLLYSDTTIATHEAEALIELNQLCPRHEPAWRDFYIEAVTDYLVNDVAPHGYLTAANAAWLTAQICRDGRIANKLDIELLVALLDRARWSPEVLTRLALEQVLDAVKTGAGPLRAAGEPEAGRIADADVELLRRIVYAFGGESGLAITRAEAEVLFAINDAVADAPLNPVWSEFFVKAIANCVMAASGYKVPTREEALHREAWLERQGDITVGTLLAGFDQAAILKAYRELSREEAALARLERQRIEIITNAEVTQGEVTWLAERLGRDGTLTATEDLLVAVLARESPKLHPSFDVMVARLRTAA